MKVFIPIAALLVAGSSASAVMVEDKFHEPMTVAEFDNIFTRFGHFITHWGHDGLEFLKCLGPSFVTKCGTQLAACGLTHECIRLLMCEGKPAADCIHHIKEEHQHEHDMASTTKAPAHH